MKRKFPKIMATIINIIFLLFVISNAILHYIPYNNSKYVLILGIWAGWNITRNYYNYYKNK